MIIWCQQFEESERGWGERPDGYLLARTVEDIHRLTQAILDFQKKYFENRGIKGIPDEYTRPAGKPYRCKVSDDLAKTVQENGLRFFDNNYPVPISEDAGKPMWKWK